MLENWRWSAYRPQTWGAPVAAGPPPPSRVCGVRARDRSRFRGCGCVRRHGGRLSPPGLPPPVPCVRRTSARPRRRFRGCGCVRRVGGGRSSSARDAWSSLRGPLRWDQGASRISGSSGGAGQSGRALAGGRGCRVLCEPIRGGVEGRHRSFQIPRDGAPLGFRAGRVELDQIGGWCRLVLGFRPQWERVRLVDRPFVVDFRVPLKRDGVPLNDNSRHQNRTNCRARTSLLAWVFFSEFERPQVTLLRVCLPAAS